MLRCDTTLGAGPTKPFVTCTPTMTTERELLFQSGARLAFTSDTLTIQLGPQRKAARKDKSIPVRRVINAAVHAQTVEVHFVARKKDKGKMSLIKMGGQVKEEDADNAKEWVDALLAAAYRGCKRHKKLRILINPFGGTGRAVSTYRKKVEPVLRMAGCIMDVTHTTHNGHAKEIAQALPLDYDALLVLSGDGLVHEVFNGFAEHQRPLQAFSTPIVQIPTGSANGLSLNILGLQDGLDVVAATLNAIKGREMRIDIFSVLQGGTRRLSYMSQAVGLMADLDLGTEHLRWMGDTRFMYGLLRGLVSFKPTPIELWIKVVETDKERMLEDFKKKHRDMDALSAPPSPVVDRHEQCDDIDRFALPPLRYADCPKDESEGWIKLEAPLLWLYAGKGPFVARDFMAFPVSLPNDGLMDVMPLELRSRKRVIAAISGGPEGLPYWMDTNHYCKAHALYVKPLTEEGYISVDGEAMPFKEFHVEVHQALGTVLSPYGYYAAEFDMPTDKRRLPK